jgi:ArsR family transcriptional regulator
VIARSAGTFPATVQPLAVQVMAEAGIDIGYQQAKGLADVAAPEPAIEVTV